MRSLFPLAGVLLSVLLSAQLLLSSSRLAPRLLVPVISSARCFAWFVLVVVVVSAVAIGGGGGGGGDFFAFLICIEVDRVGLLRLPPTTSAHQATPPTQSPRWFSPPHCHNTTTTGHDNGDDDDDDNANDAWFLCQCMPAWRLRARRGSRGH